MRLSTWMNLENSLTLLNLTKLPYYNSGRLPKAVSNIKYKLYSFEADLKTRKYGINPLVDCFHASYLPILMEIRTEVLIPKIA